MGSDPPAVAPLDRIGSYSSVGSFLATGLVLAATFALAFFGITFFFVAVVALDFLILRLSLTDGPSSLSAGLALDGYLGLTTSLGCSS
jgi:hypothetical protein